MLRSATVNEVRTISQRELRNDNAEIIRAVVDDGESFTVTRHGVPVARLVPLGVGSDLPCERPATSRPRYADRPRVTASMSSEELLDELRDGR